MKIKAVITVLLIAFVMVSCTPASISDGIIKIWDLSEGKLITDLRESARSISCNSDGRIIACISDDSGEIKIWDMKLDKLMALAKGNFITGKISPNGDFITARCLSISS